MKIANIEKLNALISNAIAIKTNRFINEPVVFIKGNELYVNFWHMSRGLNAQGYHLHDKKVIKDILTESEYDLKEKLDLCCLEEEEAIKLQLEEIWTYKLLLRV